MQSSNYTTVNTIQEDTAFATTRSRLEVELQRNFSVRESSHTGTSLKLPGRGRHCDCEFLQESAGQGMGHLKFNELLSPSSTTSSRLQPTSTTVQVSTSNYSGLLLDYLTLDYYFSTSDVFKGCEQHVTNDLDSLIIHVKCL